MKRLLKVGIIESPRLLSDDVPRRRIDDRSNLPPRIRDLPQSEFFARRLQLLTDCLGEGVAELQVLPILDQSKDLTSAAVAVQRFLGRLQGHGCPICQRLAPGIFHFTRACPWRRPRNLWTATAAL